MQGKFPALATKNDYYMALAYAVRDRMLQRWISTAVGYTKHGSRTVAYLSAEFLMGPHLGNNLLNLGILEPVRECMTELGPQFRGAAGPGGRTGPGHGGLGRLAACFIDSLATLEIPPSAMASATSSGRFHQEIVDGWQIEKTDKWLKLGQSLGTRPTRMGREVKFGGHHRAVHRRTQPSAGALGAPQDRERRALRHADPRIPHQHREHPAAVARRRRPSPSISRSSTAATTTGRSTRRSRRRT